MEEKGGWVRHALIFVSRPIYSSPIPFGDNCLIFGSHAKIVQKLYFDGRLKKLMDVESEVFSSICVTDKYPIIAMINGKIIMGQTSCPLQLGGEVFSSPAWFKEGHKAYFVIGCRNDNLYYISCN